jgi:DNA adenine methylase
MIRSPFFYVGDKYKLIPQILPFFPKKIDLYIEPFLGGGSSFLNVEATNYMLNDIDKNIIILHKLLISHSKHPQLFINNLFRIIETYNLSLSYKSNEIPKELRDKFPKTYFAEFNKNNFKKLKNDFNESRDPNLLYLLLIYGFNHMIRFNKEGFFNLPVGNVDFNKNVYKSLNDYFNITSNRKIRIFNHDFETFLTKIIFPENTFIYLDPPYLISSSEYNKFWKEDDEIRLYEMLNKLNERGIKFGITNLISHYGKENTHFLNFSKKFYFKEIKSNYISFNNNHIKTNSIELFVYNYKNE